MRPDNDPVDHCQRRPGGSPVRNLLVQVHEGRTADDRLWRKSHRR